MGDPVEPHPSRFGPALVTRHSGEGGGHRLGGQVKRLLGGLDPAPEEGQQAARVATVKHPEGLGIRAGRDEQVAIAAEVGRLHTLSLSMAADL